MIVDYRGIAKQVSNRLGAESDGPENPISAAEAAYLNAEVAAEAMLEEIPNVFERNVDYVPGNASAIADFLRRAARPEAKAWLLHLADRMDAVAEAQSRMSEPEE